MKFSEGKRSSRPLQIRFVMQLMLPVKACAEAVTIHAASGIPGQICGAGPPPPMWKFTGSPRSWARDQSGSQYPSLSAGRP